MQKKADGRDWLYFDSHGRSNTQDIDQILWRCAAATRKKAEDVCSVHGWGRWSGSISSFRCSWKAKVAEQKGGSPQLLRSRIQTSDKIYQDDQGRKCWKTSARTSPYPVSRFMLPFTAECALGLPSQLP